MAVCETDLMDSNAVSCFCPGDANMVRSSLNSVASERKILQDSSGLDSLKLHDNAHLLYMRMHLAPKLCHRQPFTLHKLDKPGMQEEPS